MITHKYKAKPTTIDEIRFDSKAEARYYGHLKQRKELGEVVVFLRQVPLHLPGGVRYVVDFVVFEIDGTVRFVDVKGMDTPLSATKRKVAEAEYAPIKIEVVKW